MAVMGGGGGGGDGKFLLEMGEGSQEWGVGFIIGGMGNF